MAISKRRGSTKSGLFLTELIIAILFFAITSAICLQIFAESSLISNKSSDLTMAMNTVQSVAESFKASDGSFEHIHTLIGGNALQKDGIELLFDNNWDMVTKSPYFKILIDIEYENPRKAVISAFKTNNEADNSTDELIYQIVTKKYIPIN